MKKTCREWAGKILSQPLPLRRCNPLSFGIILLLLAVPSCRKDLGNFFPDKNDFWPGNGHGYGKYNPAMVITWNQAAIQTVQKIQHEVPDPPIPPFIESRFYAMVQIAIHDALNHILPRYETYALHQAREKNADPDIAVAQAAYEVITSMSATLNPPAFVSPPSVKDFLDDLLSTSLSKQVKQEAKDKGIALGKAAAAAILANRANDGAANSMFPVTEGNTPGAYRFTFPFNGPPFNTPPFSGLYDSPGWGQVKPFGLESGSQFRAGPPDPVNSAAYTKDFIEVKRLGRFNSTDRTNNQTEIARFWAESSPQGWNRIALAILKQKPHGAWETARLLALLQMAEADAYIGSMEAKYFYFYWRPVSAIRLADTDGNPDTNADPDWDVLGWNPAGPPDLRFWPTPPIADYPSAHALAGGAGAEVIKRFFGKDNFNFSVESGSWPVTRHFSSLSQAARENSLSRIYIGFHFRKACIEGEHQGVKTGKYITQKYLREK